MKKIYSFSNFSKINNIAVLAIYIATSFSLFCGKSATAQSPNWLWAKKAGGFSDELVSSVATDASGNVYVVGHFYSSYLTFYTTTLTCAGFDDIFLAKYDVNGNFIWAKRAGENQDDLPYSVATDASGNVYVAGSFASNTISFGTITLTNTSLNNFDMFLTKYDPNGNVIWAKSVGGIDFEEAYSVATDDLGNIYVTGSFQSFTINFDSDTLTNNGSFDIFLTKFDTSGNVIWAKSAGGSFFDVPYSVATDESGSIYVAGYFGSSTIIFGSDTLTNEGALGYMDIFLTKYDSSGNVIWAKSAGGISHDLINSIATDSWGNVYVAGFFESPTINIGSTTLSCVGDKDIFLAAYDSTGNVIWVKNAGGTDFDEAFSVATDTSGNVYVIGSFQSSAINFDSDTLTNTGGFDVFLTKYNTSGNVIWAKSVGGDGTDEAFSVAIDLSDNVFVGGFFTSSSLSFGSNILIGSGTNDMFIAKLNALTGVENLQSTYEVMVYPNPSNGIFNIQIINNESVTLNYELNIYNTIGEKIFSQKSTTDKTEIDLSSHPNGIYFIKAITGNIILNRKISIINN